MNSKAFGGSAVVVILVILSIVGRVARIMNRHSDREQAQTQSQRAENSGGSLFGLSRDEMKVVEKVAAIKKDIMASPEREKPFLTRKVSFKTNLQRQGKAPLDWEAEELPRGLELVTYESNGLQLKAALYVPPNLGNKKRPALVFFHGGFSLYYGSIDICESFVDDDFIVLMPMLRGENGGNGNYEMFVGELDDAANAIRWLSKHKNVDADNIYAFGHSIGGGVSAMMSLMDDNLPLKHCGSSGGLYGPDSFYAWRHADSDGPDIVRFDPENINECLMRVLQGNVKWMKRKHYAYIGIQDQPFFQTMTEMRQENAQAPDKTRLTVSQPSGDHMSSLMPAIEQYHTVVMTDLKQTGNSGETSSPRIPSRTPFGGPLPRTSTSPAAPQRTTRGGNNNIDQIKDELGHEFGDKFSETIPDHGYLVGFEISMKQTSENFDAEMVSIQPLYRAKEGDKQGKGKLYGEKGDKVERAFAPKGYAIGGLRGQALGMVKGFELVFMKIKPDGTLDPNDTQTSPWIGGNDDSIPVYSVIDGKGRHATTFSGSIFMKHINSIKLEF